jgi:spore coat protein A
VRPGALLPAGDATASRPQHAPFRQPLPIPPELRGAELTIPIREAEVQTLPGPKTRMWTYGGVFPGPTIRRPAGERTSVTFLHQLPKQVGELSVHLHGGHNRTQFDGQPGGLTKSHSISFYCDIPRGLSPRQSGNDVLIEPGGRRTYVYDLMEDGRPERGAFQWYHDHRLDHTARNVWHGLAGMWIVEDQFERDLPLPRGERDLALMIADRSFDHRNQLTEPFTERRPPADGINAKCVLVNGAHLPFHPVTARRYRLRILNASQFRPYNLHLSNGAPLVQVGTDSGLMPKPVRRESIFIAPGERVEVVVDFDSAAGERVELRSGPRHGARHPLGAHPYVGALMQFRVAPGRRLDRTRVPRKLRPLPAWTRHVSRKPKRTWEVSVGGVFKTTWLINGRTFNPAHADAHPKLDTTETWEIVNRTDVAHAMHLHHTDWYLLSRNGNPPPPWEDCLKETFFLFPRERILIAGHFADYTGKFVVHCHMLDHEDHGLMGQFEVVP